LSLLEEWVVTSPVDASLEKSVRGILPTILPPEVQPLVTIEEQVLVITVMVPGDNLSETVAQLDDVPRLQHFVDGTWNWPEEIDPLDEEQTAYKLRVEIEKKTPETFECDRELSILSVYSKDGNNHAAWPVAFVLAARIAHELGAFEPEEFVKSLSRN
jgi:hypothetical protein